MAVPRAPGSTATTAAPTERAARRAEGPRGLARVFARSHEMEQEARLADLGVVPYVGARRAVSRTAAPVGTATIVRSTRSAMRRAEAGSRAYRRPGTSRATLARISRATGSEGIGAEVSSETLPDALGMVHRAAEKKTMRREAPPLRRSPVHRTMRSTGGSLDTPQLRAMVRREIADLTTISAQAPGFSVASIAREAQKQLARRETPVTSGGGQKKGSDEGKADLDDFLLRIVRQIMRDEAVWGERIFNPFD